MTTEPAGSEAVEVGPFAIGGVLGTGGMGRVHAGVHVRTGLPVAIKLVTSERAASPAAIRRFRDEICAMARLDHDHVIRILDLGELTAEQARHLDGIAGDATCHAAAAGAPYVVMERCSGGTLRADRVGSWPQLRAALDALLAALAHAHARDVMHLDLKLSNVLEGAPGDERPGLKVIDFGLSWLARADGGEGPAAAGTPRVMAPEQILGHRRDLGPWTDLYALGCVAHELATGRPPFRGASAAEITTAHLSAQPPMVIPRFAAPAGLAAWVARLLAKDPRARHEHAADAARALASLDGDGASAWSTPPSTPERGERGSPHDTVEPTTQTAAPDRSGTYPARGDAPPSSRTPAGLPPAGSAVPGTTIALDDDDAASLVRLDRGACGEMPIGLGLRLYALRGAPFIGRVAERRRSWQALERVEREGSARAVVVTGASGLGKTRLAAWLAERAHELGAARVLRASTDPGPHAGAGLAALVARAARAAGLTPGEVQSRLGKLAGGLLRDDELRVLADLALGAAGEGAPIEPLHRHAAVFRLLRSMASARPLLVLLDDDTCDADALGLVDRVLAAQADEPAPILFVLTPRSELVAERPTLEEGLARVTRRASTEVIELGPLPAAEHALLVRKLLGLSGEVAARVEARTAGHPMFAATLVGDLIDRGLLEPGDRGFSTGSGDGLELPERLTAAWTDRSRRIIEREGPAARLAIDLAAACGHTFDEAEWREACARAGADDGVLDRLLTSQLLLPAGRGEDVARPALAFAHAMVRDLVQREAERGGRWATCCGVVADVLALRSGTTDDVDRRGRALLVAGRAAEASDVLLASAASRHARGELARGLELLELAEDALRAAPAPPEDERWGSLAALRAASWLRGGVPAEAEDLLARAITDARRHDWARALAELLWASSTLAGQRGRHAEAATQLEEALERFLALGDGRGCNKTLRCLAHVARQGGRLDEAQALLGRALALADADGDDESRGWSLQGLAAVAAARGRLDEAESTITRALRLLEGAGCAFAAAHAHNTAAEIARRRGDLETAERSYARAVELGASVGNFVRHVARLNHGLMLLDQGRSAAGRTQLLRCLRVAAEVRMALLDYGARAGLMVCDAQDGALDAFDEHLAALDRASAAAVDTETAGWIARAGDLLRRRGDRERAAEAARVAAAFRGERGAARGATSAAG